ncbi:unnamed protein product [Rhodiola kirilowii]
MNTIPPSASISLSSQHSVFDRLRHRGRNFFFPQ